MYTECMEESLMKNYDILEISLLNLQNQCLHIFNETENQLMDKLLSNVVDKNPVLFEVVCMNVFLFLSEKLEKIIYQTIKDKNTMRLRIIISNIKKINSSIGQNIMDENKLYVNLARLFILTNDSNYSFKEDLINKIVDYSTDNNDSYLDDIFVIGIKNKYVPIIDRLKKYIDIDKFVKDDTFEKKNRSVLLKTRGSKLIGYLNDEYKV